jgi:NAD(P)-dependent dehydrogenase (short-subunit alcohol dehydrogenase family)
VSGKKTAIITGASGGIGAGLVEGFLREGYNVVATSREANRKLTISGSPFSSMAISASSKLLPMLSRQQSTTSEPSMFW